jgi:hypothetical protein
LSSVISSEVDFEGGFFYPFYIEECARDGRHNFGKLERKTIPS